ncbi:hypothetical protein JW711_04095 [Candidatus Woesearchaeota archaeon]|nr:hypothetical protein [Candidatus Woesearchaeota archaeon]
MIEIEKTYLAKSIPPEALKGRSKEIIDFYIPPSRAHPDLRIRKNGDEYEITRKIPAGDGTDKGKQVEMTIPLSKEEFESLSQAPGKKIHKIRYLMDYKGLTAEVDVFQGDLQGLVLVDFEFENPEVSDAFEMPDFCLAEVTQEQFIAGGMLCGKRYEDIRAELEKFKYEKLT